jgi:hypothetical protein
LTAIEPVILTVAEGGDCFFRRGFVEGDDLRFCGLRLVPGAARFLTTGHTPHSGSVQLAVWQNILEGSRRQLLANAAMAASRVGS